MMDDSFVVSPYVQEIPNARASGYLEHLAEGDERAKLRELHANGDVALLFDILNFRAVALTREDLAWLGALKAARAKYRPREEGPRERAARERLVEDEVLLAEEQAYRRHRYQSVEIEINRHCNLRCVFCPVALRPKPKGFMSDETFELVLDRAREYGAPQISLNHYSEPGLDPKLVEKVKMAAQRGQFVVLNTNLSLMNDEKIAGLAEAGNVVRIIVNLPSVDRAEYERITGTKMFDRVIANLRLLHRYGLSTRLSVNAPRDAGGDRLKAINDEFAEMFGATFLEPTDSRAGSLERDDYAPLLRHSGPLNGCPINLWQINVNHEGVAFLCCNDFDQSYALGDLRVHSLREIAESEQAVALRRSTFGGDSPSADFICSKCAWTRPIARDGGALQVGDPSKAVLYDEVPPPTELRRSGSLARAQA